MSATAFQRQRRELAKKKEQPKQEPESVGAIEGLPDEELKKVTNDDMRSRLDELGIDYDSDDIKKDLIVLLKGENGEEEKLAEEIAEAERLAYVEKAERQAEDK